MDIVCVYIINNNIRWPKNCTVGYLIIFKNYIYVSNISFYSVLSNEEYKVCPVRLHKLESFLIIVISIHIFCY